VPGARRCTSALNTRLVALKGEVSALRQELKGEIASLRHETRAENNGLEVKMMRWMIGTGIACTGAAYSVARFIH
jgi:hypothetical protein